MTRSYGAQLTLLITIQSGIATCAAGVNAAQAMPTGLYLLCMEDNESAAPGGTIFSTFPAEDDRFLTVRWPNSHRSINYEFAEAARRLASTFKGDPTDDTLLHPLLYLYRHATEMAMKAVITDAAALRRSLGERGDDVWASGFHNARGCFPARQCSSICSKVFPLVSGTSR